ncbi:MAG: hypothetical protein JWN53_363, partial [Gemmatimonadetes bacterium]|nr:hypothetical protein [Gemmatimonadota bacterium]
MLTMRKSGTARNPGGRGRDLRVMELVGPDSRPAAPHASVLLPAR